jgi:hypothetical protein
VIRVRQQALALFLGIVAGQSINPCYAFDKPELTRLFPPGARTNSTVEIEATGNFPNWPVQIWSDTTSIQWVCLPESGKLKATINSDTALGLHWVRLFGSGGATVVKPFLVGDDAERVETEPNNLPSEANEIAQLPCTVHGVLSKRAEVDLYAVTLAQGESFSAAIDAVKWIRSPADVTLQIVDANGFVISENLDHVGLDPYLEFEAPRAGKYFVRVFAFPVTPDSTVAFSGGSDWAYRLQMRPQSMPFDRTLDFAFQSELAAERIEVPIGKHECDGNSNPISRRRGDP